MDVKTKYEEDVKEKLQQCVMKVDHFTGIDKIDLVFEGAPNWRQMGSLPVFGSAQPTVKGVENVLAHYSKQGAKKVLWINMRTEPVVYVQGKSFAPRLKENPKENIELLGVSAAKINEFERFLVDQVLKDRISKNGSKMHYFQDTYALLPADRVDTEHWLESVALEDVKTVSEMYSKFGGKSGGIIELVRVPINDVPNERVPQLEDFDFLIQTVSSKVAGENGEGTIVHCNCQMGRGRTTTGMFLCALVLAKIQGVQVDVEKQKSLPKTPENGYYSIVNQLVKMLPAADEEKHLVDSLIDQCGHLINMRDFIWTKCQSEFNIESQKENKSRALFWHNLAVNYVERYFYFVLFALYLTERFSLKTCNASFEDWCKAKHELFVKIINRKPGSAEDIGGTSVLKNFNWV